MGLLTLNAKLLMSRAIKTTRCKGNSMFKIICYLMFSCRELQQNSYADDWISDYLSKGTSNQVAVIKAGSRMGRALLTPASNSRVFIAHPNVAAYGQDPKKQIKRSWTISSECSWLSAILKEIPPDKLCFACGALAVQSFHAY